jgi:hypothetical protein
MTFLVNIWLSYKPYGVKPLPDDMIGKFSKYDIFGSTMERTLCAMTLTMVIIRGGVAWAMEEKTPLLADAAGNNNDGSWRH